MGVLSRGEDLVIVGFGPPGEENVWTATYPSEIPAEMKPGAPGIGKQFRDRVVTRETVVLNEYAAELVTVTTCQLLDWYDQVVVVEQPPGYIVLTNGAIRDDRFEGFYRSLRMRRRGS